MIPGGRLSGDFQASTKRQWPNLPRPPPTWWRVYRSAIRKAFAPNIRSRRLSTAIKLATPLGRWLNTPRNVISEHHRNSDEAFVVDGDTIHRYAAVTQHHFKISGTVESIPDDAHPVTAFHDDDEFFTMYPYSLKSITPPTPKSLILKSSLIQGPDMAGSDGSVDVLCGHRACAYCVQLNGARYEGRQRYPNSPFATSYRAELEGCLNTIKMMQELPTPDGIDQYIDNSETVQRTINKVLPNKVLAPEADIILAIHHELNNNMTIRPDTKWLESHQDDLTFLKIYSRMPR